MTKQKFSLSKRLLAVVLSILMVFSIPVTTVFAATAQHPDAVTITVTDEEGKPVEGAEVSFVIDSVTNGDLWKQGTEKTDSDGVVEVLPKAEFVENDMTITASISKDKFESNDTSIVDSEIISSDQNFDVQLISNSIKDVIIEGKNLTYNGNAQELVSVTEVAGDTVSFDSVEGEYTLNDNGKPVATDAGTYKIQVTVKRAGKDDLVETVTTIINPDNIKVDFTEKAPEYNEAEQELVTVTGAENIPEGSKVIWYLDDEEYSYDIQTVPKAIAVGEYNVRLVIDGNPNYKKFDLTKKVSIRKSDIDLEGLTVDGLSGIYKVDENGEPIAQKAVKVTPEYGYDYTLKYQLDDGDMAVDDNAWVEEIPTVTNAGSYIVWVKAVKDGYNDSEVPVNPAAGAIAPYNVYIAKAEQTVSFGNYQSKGITTVSFDELNTSNNVYDFIAHGGVVNTNDIEYKIENASEDGVDVSEIATISKTGKITVLSAGAIKVTATRKGNENYNDGVAEHILVVTKNSNLISFKNNELTYVLGENQGIVSSQQAIKTNKDDNGSITYTIDNQHEKYLSIDINGNLQIKDYQKLADAMDASADDKISVTVKADKSAGTKKVWDWGSFSFVDKTIYERESTSYIVEISFFATPTNPYIISGTKNENGWYKAEISISATDSASYEIAKECDYNAFSSSITYDNEGIEDRYVYLRNIATGGITNRIVIEGIKIDTVAPKEENMHIKFNELNIIEKLGIKFGFYNPSVDIKFIIDDENGSEESGVDHIEWFYNKDLTATSSIEEEKSGTLLVTCENGRYVATLTLTATEAEQFRGYIAFKAFDVAGNESEMVTEDGVVIVVDTISPTMQAKFKASDTVNETYGSDITNGVKQHYFNGSVDFTFTVQEANFFTDNVVIDVKKDGEEYETNINWTVDSENDEKHYGHFTLSGDGDYIVSMTYKDQSENVMVDAETKKEIKLYTSEVITIDETKPIIDFNFDQKSQNTVFTVTEHNFRAEDIIVTGEIKDINGKYVNGITADDITKQLHTGEWTQKGDVYTFETDDYKDGIYDLTINYKDIAGNEADVNEPENFIIDHNSPTDVTIDYSVPITQTILKTLTLGFYNPDVTVTFTAFDTSAGVESFTWNYTKQDGQSNINRPTDDEEKIKEQVIPAVQDKKDKSKFTAEITLTAAEAEQIRGYISVLATDAYKNESDKVKDDDYVIVVDNISPTMTVEYSKEARMVGTTAYYNGDVTATFIVNEANFFAEDVKVKVAKDGSNPYSISPSWIDESSDVHVGTYTLSGDGDYVIYVEYTDRSKNKMESYTSHMITIDTVAPIIDVEYNNENPINTLRDSEGNERKYFDNTQTAIVTITEHNFNAEEVDFSIAAKDVTGNELDDSLLHVKSTWTVDSTGDVHKITLTYPGDANYTFDISYADLATNKAADYDSDYFTVDKTDAVNLSVNYSTSVLDTILESLSFGFYNAKMKVTITAEDHISGVYSFLYSYKNAVGVSSVNAELINQKIEAADIQYSEGGEKATATFEIPKMILGSDNQFNGTVEFTATDRCGNESDQLRDAKRIVVDNIAPNAQVSYNEATNVVGDISYYNGSINATVTINEANFYADDVQVLVSKDGAAETAVTPSWSNNSVDVHVGTFTLTEDGDYIITINYKDKSSNSMAAYSSNQMTIDTKIDAPTYTVNGTPKSEEGGAYKGNATIGFNFEDQNFASNKIKLIRTRFDSVEDVTDEFINVNNKENGGSGTFTIPSEVENDGIYILSISIMDKANHTAESQMKFTINRYGSVYEYDDYLVSLIKDGGQYVKIEGDNKTAITQDLIITEYNASQILEDSLNILITRDGEALDAKYTVNPTIDSNAGIGESGWYQYVYTIDQENFAEDGVYKITLASTYAASDSEKNDSTSVPENSIDESGRKILDTINFTVDTTAPEIRNIVNLDEAIVNAQALNIDYTVVDVGGLKSIEVILNGRPIDTVTEFGDSAFNYSGKFTINESSDAQTVQIRVTDIAGNITDTASEDFSTNDLYVFNDVVTVSTNFFVRWYANKTIFWLSIVGIVAIAMTTCAVVAYKRKKNESTD